MPPESIRRLIVAARRRMVMARALQWSVAAVAMVATGGALLLGLARSRVMPWAEEAVLVAAGVAVVAAVVASLVTRPSDRAAALAVDQRLHGRDQLSTTLELIQRPHHTDLEQRQIGRSTAWAEGRSLEGFGSVLPGRRLVGLAVLGVAASLLLAIPSSPADAEQQQRAQISAVVDDAAAELEAAAEEAATEETAETLRRAAEELRRAESLDEAVQRLGDTRQQLAELDDPQALPLKTALEGLDERLRQDPVGAGDDALSQLSDLRDTAASLSAEERAAAAASLEELAGQLDASAPDLARALAGAAEALASAGDPSAALDRALDEMVAAGDRVASAEDLADARAAVRSTQQDLADARDRQAREGDGDGQGQGDGDGDGQGQGQGNGDGQGQGEGQGQGQGQGQGTGTGTGQGQGQGQGGGGGGSGSGANNPNPVSGGTGTGNGVFPGQGDNDVVRDPERGEVLDPAGYQRGAEERVDFSTSDPTGEVQGRTTGDGLRNVPLVPYTERIAEYRDQALDALDRMSIPGNLQDIVRDYFTELGS